MTWKQFLTEKVLKERILVEKPERCKTCKGLDCNDCADNRTFNNRNDLMDLYQQVYEDGKWDDFFWDFAFKRKPENYGLGEAETSVWLFCLDGKDYEAQCKMVAEFYGWEEK